MNLKLCLACGRRSNKQKRCLSNFEVADFIVGKNITTAEQLFAKADGRKDDGENDLANFLFSRMKKSTEELIKKLWMLKQASSKI